MGRGSGLVLLPNDCDLYVVDLKSSLELVL